MTNIGNPATTKSPISESAKVIPAQRDEVDRVIAPGRFAEHLEADSDPAPAQGKSRAQAPRPNPAPARSFVRARALDPGSSEPSLPAPQKQPKLNDTSPPLTRATTKDSNADVVRASARSTPDAAPAPRIQDTSDTRAPLTRRPGDEPIDANRNPGPVTAPVAIASEGSSTPVLPRLEPEAPEDWRQKLEMLLLGGSPELFMQQSPALALLSGHMEYVEPQQIPAVVAQSPLLQGILSTATTADALETAMPLEQNLKILGLIPADMPTAALGLEPLSQQPLVKIADTMKALGFDLSRVMQEGDLLKDNLSLDGLQSYMQRAERLRASLGLPLTLMPQTAMPQPSTPPSVAGINPANSQRIDPELSAKLSRLAPQNTRTLSTVQLWSQVPERPELMPLTILDDGTDFPVFLAPMDPDVNVDTWDPFASMAPDLAPDPTPPAPTMDNVPLVMNVLPRAPVTPQDPFLAIAQRWNPNTVQTLRPEESMAQDARDIPAGQQPLRSLDDLLHRHLIQPPEINARLDAGPAPTQENTLFDVSTLQLSLQDLTSTSDNSGSGPSDQNPNSSFMNQDANALFTPSASPTFGTQKAFTIETGAPQAPQPAVNPQHLQEIFDKSSMLIKDGGGSIRVDLGSREMGPLDLALDIKGNNVELRIVTHSNQARDALVQELPRLRESLHNQHLNLDKVEIGLSYNSAFSQQSGSNPQNRDQFFENSRETSSRGPQGIRSTTRSYRQSFATGPEPRVPLHNGLIQVRV